MSGSKIDPTLGIKARRSKRARPSQRNIRNPLLDHTIDEDLPEIRRLAAKYAEMDSKMKSVIDLYVFPGKTLDYYYGAYMNSYQLFTMAYMSNNDIAPTIMCLIHTICHRIVELLNSAAAEIAGASEVPKKVTSTL